VSSVCRIEYYNYQTYILWIIEFFTIFYSLSIVHECLHGFYAIITGGSFTQISIYRWILFVPVLCIDVRGGNEFLVTEGTLITTWLIALLLLIFTSFNFLRLVMDYCKALNLSGKLFGVQLGAAVKAIGEGVYALPNFVFPEAGGSVKAGDGTLMYYWFESVGYSGDVQYVIAFLMIIGGICALIWVLRCHNIFCMKCSL